MQLKRPCEVSKTRRKRSATKQIIHQPMVATEMIVIFTLRSAEENTSILGKVATKHFMI